MSKIFFFFYLTSKKKAVRRFNLAAYKMIYFRARLETLLRLLILKQIKEENQEIIEESEKINQNTNFFNRFDAGTIVLFDK